MKSPEFRVRLETPDGQLVANRLGDPTLYFRYGKLDTKTVELILAGDCREKGVRLLSYTGDRDGIRGIVVWL